MLKRSFPFGTKSGKCKVLIFLRVCSFARMLCTGCPPTILGGLYRIPEKSPKSSTDKMNRACELKDQTLKKIRTLHLPDLVPKGKQGHIEAARRLCICGRFPASGVEKEKLWIWVPKPTDSRNACKKRENAIRPQLVSSQGFVSN